MRSDFSIWLDRQQYAGNTKATQLHRVRKVEEAYGDLAGHLANATYDSVIASLQYSTADERAHRANASKMVFEGNIRNNLQSYKNAALRYRRFLQDCDMGDLADLSTLPAVDVGQLVEASEDQLRQRFSLERDMQAALRLDISRLEQGLRIVDDGAERSVDSGFIDITCEDADGAFVVVELKAGKADSRAIGQILGYMGDVAQEEDGRAVRGILVAHDFDKRARAAARVVPSLTLKRYSIEFRFDTEE